MGAGFRTDMRAGSCISMVMVTVVALAGCRAAVADGGQPLQGLYLQLQWAGTAMQYVHYYYWHDGRVCHVTPQGGIDHEPADFASIQKQTAQQGHKCGQYRVRGNIMTVQWEGEAAHDERMVNVHGDSFELNQFATSKVGSYGSGKLLDGIYSATAVGDGMSTQTYTFHPDGTFQFTDKPIVGKSAPRAETGNYKLAANTLQVGARRLTALPFPGDKLMIEGTVFAK